MLEANRPDQNLLTIVKYHRGLDSLPGQGHVFVQVYLCLCGSLRPEDNKVAEVCVFLDRIQFRSTMECYGYAWANSILLHFFLLNLFLVRAHAAIIIATKAK